MKAFKSYLKTGHSIKILWIITLGLSISACGPTIKQSPQKQLINDDKKEVLSAEPEAGKGTLFVIYTGVNGVLAKTKIDDKLIGQVDYGFIRLDLIPGNYSISSASGYRGNSFFAPITFKIEEGKTYYKLFGWQTRGNKTYTKVFDFNKRANELQYMPAHQPAKDASVLYPIDVNTSLDGCIGAKIISECHSLKNAEFFPLLQLADRAAVEELIAEDERQKAEMRALEESLPPSLRRDKYMLQLSTLLKEKNYKKALPVFEKLTALGLPLDPSFDYFRGESYLNVNKKTEALRYLYNYIRNQGSSAKYYKQALELINKAEGS